MIRTYILMDEYGVSQEVLCKEHVKSR